MFMFIDRAISFKANQIIHDDTHIIIPFPQVRMSIQNKPSYLLCGKGLTCISYLLYIYTEIKYDIVCLGHLYMKTKTTPTSLLPTHPASSPKPVMP